MSAHHMNRHVPVLLQSSVVLIAYNYLSVFRDFFYRNTVKPLTSKRKSHTMTAGNSSKCSLKCAPVRLIPAEYFLTGFHADTTCEELYTYVSSTLSLKCSCQRLPTRHNSYSSFKLCVDIPKPNLRYDADLRPAGTKIGRYFPPRKHTLTDSTHL